MRNAEHGSKRYQRFKTISICDMQARYLYSYHELKPLPNSDVARTESVLVVLLIKILRRSCISSVTCVLAKLGLGIGLGTLEESFLSSRNVCCFALPRGDDTLLEAWLDTVLDVLIICGCVSS